jgi:hypothetical protein
MTITETFKSMSTKSLCLTVLPDTDFVQGVAYFEDGKAKVATGSSIKKVLQILAGEAPAEAENDG